MTKLCPLFSGSDGNCYYIGSAQYGLICTMRDKNKLYSYTKMTMKLIMRPPSLSRQ